LQSALIVDEWVNLSCDNLFICLSIVIMQDSLERLYQCFLRTSHFAQSCAVYQQVAESEKYQKEAKIFWTLAVHYSEDSRIILWLYQNAKEQSMSDDFVISTEIGSFAWVSDTMENLNRASKNLQQFVDEYISECADICAQEGLMTISADLWELEKEAKRLLLEMG